MHHCSCSHCASAAGVQGTHLATPQASMASLLQQAHAACASALCVAAHFKPAACCLAFQPILVSLQSSAAAVALRLGVRVVSTAMLLIVLLELRMAIELMYKGPAAAAAAAVL